MKPDRIRTLEDLARAKKQLKQDAGRTRDLMQKSLIHSGRKAFINYLIPLGITGLAAWGVKKMKSTHEPSDATVQAQSNGSPKPFMEGVKIAGRVLTTVLPTVLSLIESYQSAEEE
ncbi:MAG: hypothetical protein KDC57_06285 [Saprospiraceae bacterium]|nr:hypothetical protein [Saprospiraceae bacterium]